MTKIQRYYRKIYNKRTEEFSYLKNLKKHTQLIDVVLVPGERLAPIFDRIEDSRVPKRLVERLPLTLSSQFSLRSYPDVLLSVWRQPLNLQTYCVSRPNFCALIEKYTEENFSLL